MIAVVIRCQSYPGTFQFAAARLSGREGRGQHALPALGGIAHSKFEHAGRSCAIFVANTVARVSGEPGEGLAAARGLRGFAVKGNHGRLPAFNFSRRFRSPGHLSHRALNVLQDALRDVSKKLKILSFVLAHGLNHAAGAKACGPQMKGISNP